MIKGSPFDVQLKESKRLWEEAKGARKNAVDENMIRSFMKKGLKSVIGGGGLQPMDDTDELNELLDELEEDDFGGIIVTPFYLIDTDWLSSCDCSNWIG